jgi:hypothetical protein
MLIAKTVKLASSKSAEIRNTDQFKAAPITHFWILQALERYQHHYRHFSSLDLDV